MHIYANDKDQGILSENIKKTLISIFRALRALKLIKPMPTFNIFTGNKCRCWDRICQKEGGELFDGVQQAKLDRGNVKESGRG